MTIIYVEEEKQKGFFNLPGNKKPENNLLKKDEKSLAQAIRDKIKTENKNTKKPQQKK